MAIKIISEFEVVLSIYYWTFNRKNINRIAKEYDAVIEKFEAEIKSATLKDSRGRIFWAVFYKDATEK